MTNKDRSNNLAEIIEGSAKGAAGHATGDDTLVTDARVNPMKGNLKQAGEKAQDARKVDPVATP